MKRSLLFSTLIAAGCAESVPAPAPEAVPIAALPTQPQPAPLPVSAKLTPVVMPSDLGGRQVTLTLMPSVPQDKLPITTAPRPRKSELDGGEIPVKAMPIVLPVAGMPAAKPMRITPPKERVPSDLGGVLPAPTKVQAPIGPGDVHPEPVKIQAQTRPLVKAPSVVNPGAADVDPLVRMVPDKASTDDPTADVLSAGAIATKFPVPTEPFPFVRFTIPDPFEFAGQLKGKLPRQTEFAMSPTGINPGMR